MTRRRWIFIGAGVFILLAGLPILRAMRQSPSIQEGQGAYYCPMHPSFTSDRPGDCPICNMKLVLREAPAADSHPSDHTSPGSGLQGYAPVQLTAQRQQFIGVRTVPAEKRPLTKTVRTVGRIAYDPELYQAEEEYLQAFRSGVSSLLQAARLRLKLLGMSEELLADLEKQGVPDASLLLTDPSGRVWVYAPVYEFELPLVQLGQLLTAEVPSLPGVTLEGRILAIDPVLDPLTRSARVRAVLTDPDRRLKPEMFVNILLTIGQKETLAVPKEAIFDTGTRKIVFVSRGEGLFEPREVVVGFYADEAVEIREGIAEGEPVVVSGNFLIDSESRLKSALQGMSGGEGHKHGQ